MRLTRVAQASLFDNYSKHEVGVQLKELSRILDKHPDLLSIIAKDLIASTSKKTGRTGLSVDSIFRCLLLKQKFQISYEQLAFHLSDSITYRTFARLSYGVNPSRSGLQSTIRKITPASLEKLHTLLSQCWFQSGELSLEKIRIDSTVVASNIAPPSDSQLLNDGVRVLSRLLAKSLESIGMKVRFTDKRPAAKSLAFKIFNAKKAAKDLLYIDLLKIARLVIKQANRGLVCAEARHNKTKEASQWTSKVEHYNSLLLRIIDQTERRVINQEKVPSSEKLVSIFEPHTDIIVKGFRDVQYGHKINLSSESHGFITHLSIEEGNTADSELFMPVLASHQLIFNQLPNATVADGGYASQANVTQGRMLGIKRVVFHKPVGLSLQAMGVKKKTFDALRHFRAGVEGNISELKRVFGAGKAIWKGYEGFKAFVWSAVLSYNLVRLARQNSF